jgi:hypothetical protein
LKRDWPLLSREQGEVLDTIWKGWPGEEVGAKLLGDVIMVSDGKATLLRDEPAGRQYDYICRHDDALADQIACNLFGAYVEQRQLCGRVVQSLVDRVDAVAVDVAGAKVVSNNDDSMTVGSLRRSLRTGEDTKYRVLNQDPTLNSYVEFDFEDVDEALSRIGGAHLTCWNEVLNCVVHHRDAWSYNRLVCQGMKLIMNNKGIDLWRSDVDWGISVLPLVPAAKLLNAQHEVVRLAKKPIWDLRKAASNSVEPGVLGRVVNLFDVADCTYGRDGLGRNAMGADILDEIVTRWEPIDERQTPDESGHLNADSYYELESDELYKFWDMAYQTCDHTARVDDFDGVDAWAQQYTGSGFGRSEAHSYRVVLTVKASSHAARQMIKEMKTDKTWFANVHPTRRALMEYTTTRQRFEEAVDAAAAMCEAIHCFEPNSVIEVGYFLKKESGKDRFLFQVKAAYDSRAMMALLPYLRCWWHHPLVCVGATGEKSFEDIAHRLSRFGMYASSACADHKGYNEKHSLRSCRNFWHQLRLVEQKYGVLTAGREENFKCLEEQVGHKLLVVKGSEAETVYQALRSAERRTELPKGCGEGLTFWKTNINGNDVLVIWWWQSLMSAKLDTMLRNCGLAIPYFEGMCVIVTLATGEVRVYGWVKGDDSGIHFNMRPYVGQWFLISGHSMKHVLSWVKCLAGEIGELERLVTDGLYGIRSICRTIGNAQCRSPQSGIFITTHSRVMTMREHFWRMRRQGVIEDNITVLENVVYERIKRRAMSHNVKVVGGDRDEMPASTIMHICVANGGFGVPPLNFDFAVEYEVKHSIKAKTFASMVTGVASRAHVARKLAESWRLQDWLRKCPRLERVIGAWRNELREANLESVYTVSVKKDVAEGLESMRSATLKPTSDVFLATQLDEDALNNRFYWRLLNADGFIEQHAIAFVSSCGNVLETLAPAPKIRDPVDQVLGFIGRCDLPNLALVWEFLRITKLETGAEPLMRVLSAAESLGAPGAVAFAVDLSSCLSPGAQMAVVENQMALEQLHTPGFPAEVVSLVNACARNTALELARRRLRNVGTRSDRHFLLVAANRAVSAIHRLWWKNKRLSAYSRH